MIAFSPLPTLEKKVPMAMPDADPEVVKLASEAFGYSPKAAD